MGRSVKNASTKRHAPAPFSQGSFSHGDGTNENLQNYLVTAQDNTADWILGTKVWTHTFPTRVDGSGNPFRVFYTSCCRIGSLQNGASE